MSTGTLIERVEDPASPPVEERFAPASRPARPAVETIRETHAMRIMWRGLELPTRVVRDEASATPKYARFTIEPFERGFGTTVGNSIRRILLSSLEGAAVSSVKIAGVQHEFSSLPGVMEDVPEIILNVKSLIVRLDSDGPRTMRLEVQGRKGEMTEVRASHIVADAAITVVNPDLRLATLTDAVNFAIEFSVEKGRGYRSAEENVGIEPIIGVIPVDSVFSPVTRVRYHVEDTRVGQRTNYDRLVIEVWTKGTVSPDMALVEAAKILRKHLNPFVQYAEAGHEVTAEGVVAAPREEPIDEEMRRKLAMRVTDLELSVRASNCLESAKIETVGALIGWQEAELLKLRSFGKTSLREVKRKLADLGLSLGMKFGGGGTPPSEGAVAG